MAICIIQLAFVALKALKWALKGQELTSDTLEILNANAYHHNSCWKVDEQCHTFGCFSILLAKIQIPDFRYSSFDFGTILFTSRVAILAPTAPVAPSVTAPGTGRHWLAVIGWKSPPHWRELCNWPKIATLLTRALWLVENRHFPPETSDVTTKNRKSQKSS